MDPFSSLLVFPHFLLITIDRIIFTFFLNFFFTLSLFPPLLLFCLNFIPLLLCPAFPIRRSFSYFTNFFISFFKFFLIFVVLIQFSSSITSTSTKILSKVAKRQYLTEKIQKWHQSETWYKILYNDITTKAERKHDYKSHT